MKNQPSLATIYDYRDPISRTRSVIKELIERVGDQKGANHLDQAGWFVLAFASFEAMLSDLLSFHLLENPHLLPQGSQEMQTVLIAKTSNGFSLLKMCVDKYVRSLAYQKMDDFFKKVGEKLTIGPVGSAAQVASISGLRDVRNAILHTNIHYLQGMPRAFEDIVVLVEICDLLLDRVESRFGGLTRVAAIKRLWEFVFNSPIMRPFEDFFEVDTAEDRIHATKLDPRELEISDSERLYYELWISHFRGNTAISGFHVRKLSGDKLFWLLNTFNRIALWGDRFDN